VKLWSQLPRRKQSGARSRPTGLHALDNPWQEAYVAAYAVSEAEHERVQTPCSRKFQPLALTQL